MKFSASTNIPECNIKEKQACSTWWNQATATENKPNMNVSILAKAYPYGVSKVFFICLHFATQKLYLVNLRHILLLCLLPSPTLQLLHVKVSLSKTLNPKWLSVHRPCVLQVNGWMRDKFENVLSAEKPHESEVHLLFWMYFCFN